MKEISFSFLCFGKTGQREVGVAGIVCRDGFRAAICSGKGWGREGGGSWWHSLAPKVETHKGRAHSRLLSVQESFQN